MNLKMNAFAAAVALSGSVAFAGNLPPAVDGQITVEGEVVVDDSAGAAALEAASKIVLAEGSALRYTASVPLALSADVSGFGAFIGENAAPGAAITLSGDNSGLVAPGHFAFTNTFVKVASKTGLGSSRTDVARFYGDPRMQTFDDGSAAFTNNVALYLHSSSYQVFCGSESGEKKFVQNASLTYNTVAYNNGGRHFRFRNNFEMISGVFMLDNGNFNGTYLHRDPTGNAGEVCFSGTSEVKSVYNYYSMIVYFSNLKIGGAKFEVPGGIATDAERNITMYRENVLGERTVLNPYAQGLIHELKGYYYNLNGFNQRISHLGYRVKPNFASVGSDEPCYLKTVSASGGRDDAPFCFRGALSYWHDTARTNIFKALSVSTGELKVTSGQVVFAPVGAGSLKGGGWSGQTVTVSGAGSLVCSSSDSLATGSHNLVVEDGGELIVDEGVSIALLSARFGEVELEPCRSYSVAELQTLLADENVRVSGGGRVAVSPESVIAQWDGWPEAGSTNSVSIPDGQVVEITDADMERVEALESIYCGLSSRIVCRTSPDRTLSLGADISGACEIVFDNAGKVVLTGDNSRLWKPGGFVFSNTTVVVSNMYGLGGADTGAARFYPANPFNNYAIDRIKLTFGGPAISNFVAMVMDRCFYMGHADPDVTFVHCNDFTQLNGTASGDARGYYMNKFRFERGNIRHTSISVFGGAEVTIGRDCAVTGFEGVFGGGRFNVESRDISFGTFRIEQSLEYVRFFNDYCLNSTGNSLYFYDGSDTKCYLDLNGHSQMVGQMDGNVYMNNENSRILTVTSSVPANLVIAGKASRGLAVNFVDHAGLVYSGSSTQKIGRAKSPTVAPLEINSGAVLFERGAGWLGTNVIVNGGTLIVSPSSVTNTFGEGRETRTELIVAPGGKVEIGSNAYIPTVKSITYDGKLLKRGVYSAANCDFITGAGALRAVGGRLEGSMIIVR